MKIATKVQCVECEREFDLAISAEADEWYEGHDCEEEE
jgi:hypothetical protein